MPERRGVRKNASLKQNVQDPGAREAFRNVEDRIQSIEQRISPPDFTRVESTVSSVFAPTTDIITNVIKQRYNSVGGTILGQIVSNRDANPFSNFGVFDFQNAVDNDFNLTLVLYRDELAIKQQKLIDLVYGDNNKWSLPIGLLWFWDNPGTGNFTYSLALQMSNANTSFQVSGLCFEFIELSPLR